MSDEREFILLSHTFELSYGIFILGAPEQNREKKINATTEVCVRRCAVIKVTHFYHQRVCHAISRKKFRMTFIY